MAHVENLTMEELGAILMVCGMLMMENELLLGAALDGSSSCFIRAQLTELLDDDDDRLEKLACIDPDQVLVAMNNLAWWQK